MAQTTYTVRAAFRLLDGTTVETEESFLHDPLDGYPPADQGGLYDFIDAAGLADVGRWEEVLWATLEQS